MTKPKKDSVVIADFGEFGSIIRFDISEYAKNKKLSVEEILEIINSMKLSSESPEFNSLIFDQTAPK